MIEYNKIETPYVRSTDGSKKLIEGTFRSPAVMYLCDLRWVFTEKIDGTNIRVCWDGHRVSLAGRTDRAQIPAHLLKKLNEMFMTAETEELFEQLFGEKEVILFGEGYGAKIQKGGGDYSPEPNFIMFDVWVNGKYLERDDAVRVADAFGVASVPVILRGTIKDAVEYVKKKPKSTIGVANMEGLVGRPLVGLMDGNGNRLIIKVKVRDFE